ncbi:hypothetical protein VOLCADRAFT_94849 [Volvox carteri f. nagariensis]|uniref:Uncharacterized protein n=1 Tax=Volvox carteri f. nagariensis TaxID=3068 RepID=D8U5X8_VOLCA|nr:uncharacterized protein VOLCADRAFT_94849 [Volvox carteri f. nagariensis]EFJ44762.1 hypothetical protein VOLCADRAFT_94849 [Volvox carteri f. nagariensis]|eukprot:XP_002954045.1 hypothetical protein VOLCADRAFT_94849 [Volvox carteri f. nagariensis]
MITVKVVQSLADAAAAKMLLCGHTPEVAFTSALASVQFYVTQQQLQAQLREAQLNKKLNKVQEACRRKVEEVHKAYTQAKRKYEEMLQSHAQTQQDNQELQAKYAQKSMQARKLQEIVKKQQQHMDKQQQEIEMLRQGASRGQPLGGGHGVGAHGMGRSPLSPLAPGDVVTTVHRTQVFADLSSPPAVGGYGKEQAALPSSGRVQGITGGYRNQHGGNNNGDAGGFLGGSMSGGSPMALASQGMGHTSSFGTGLGAGMRHGSGVSGQDPNNNALRKMLGMAPAQNGLLGGRSAPVTRPDLFSM